MCTPCLCIDCLRVGIVGWEVESHGAEDAELGGHLLHPPQSPLLLCVCKLHHKTRRSSLCGIRWISQQQLPIILDYLVLSPSFYSFISSIRSRQMFTVNSKHYYLRKMLACVLAAIYVNQYTLVCICFELKYYVCSQALYGFHASC